MCGGLISLFNCAPEPVCTAKQWSISHFSFSKTIAYLFLDGFSFTKAETVHCINILGG